MTQITKRILICFICALILFPLCSILCFAEEKTELITDFNSLMTAVQSANDGETLLVGDIDFSPLSPDVPNSMMYITVEKSLTIKSGKADGVAVFLNGGFVLSGSKLTDEKISVRFENIVFDGKADQDTLTEKDYEYPWNEAEQVYTYYASLKAQQALSFAGNVDAAFSGCVFKNYMHEYGPVIDIRYADYTGNEYINLPDYSGCSLNLNFENCRIENNSALYDGGAIYIEANKNVVLKANNSVFSGNRSTAGDFRRGGGFLWASGATLNFTDCTLEKNTANHVFSDSTLSDYDTNKGGALCLEACNLNIVNSVMRENRASIGGALSMTNTKADIDGCLIIGNRAEYHATNLDRVIGPWSNMGMGGGLYIEGNSNDTVNLINCEIKNNSAANAYGGIYGYYVSFEDPSLPTYNIKMILCTYEDNKDNVDYDYSTVGDLLWMSHPGDMFTNPHFTFFGCYITDETFDKDFPRNDSPTVSNGYNYLSSKASEEILKSTIPAEEVKMLIGDRYGDKLKDFHIGSNYSDLLYKEADDLPSETDPIQSNTEELPINNENDMGWLIAVFLILFAAFVFGVFILHKRIVNKSSPIPEAQKEAPRQIVMTRYSDSDIDRFISISPEVGLLTSRELEVLREILRGKKQGEVAYYLGIGVSTVKDFYKKIYTKLNVANKNELFMKVTDTIK